MLKPSIRTKLFFGFFSILGLVVIIFLFSFFQYKRLAGLTESLYKHPLQVSNAVREVNTNLIRLHHSIINIAIAENEEALRIANIAADSSIDASLKNFSIIYERFLGEKTMIDSAFSGFESMRDLKKQIVNIKKEQGNDEAIVFSRKNLSDKLKSTVVHTKGIADFAADKANSFYLESFAKMKYYQNMMVGISLFLIIIGFIIAIWLSNRISGPILAFARNTYQLLHGENVKIPTNPSEETLLDIITEELKSNYEKLRNELLQKEIAENTIRQQYEKINNYSNELTLMNQDLEERAKLKAQELFKSERNFKQLFNGINDAVFVYEMENEQLSCIQEFNEAGERLLEYSAEELKQMKITDLLGENSAKEFSEMLRLRKDETEFTVDMYYLTRKGESIPVEICTQIFTIGDSEKFLSIGRNISERIAREIQLKVLNEEIVKQNEEYQSINEEYISINEELTQTIEELSNTNIMLEEAKEKAEQNERLKSAFLANMSHEIRTPMNGIMGFADLINGENISLEQRNRFANIILKSSKQLLQILNDILDMSRIEANEVKMVIRPVNINELLNDLFIFFSSDKGFSEGIDFKLKKTLTDSNAGILTDETRLRQVLTNLLNNAFKFTDSGYITFGYELINGRELEFFVQDSGIGIPYHKQASIFERFNQAEDSINSKYGGTGLGLSISKGLIKLLGGNIRIESEVDKGSTFYFTIPYHEVLKNKKEKQIGKLARYDWKGKTIMIVDDDPVGRDYLSEILKSTGVTTIFAENGEEGLEIVRENSEISLVLMDIRLPGMSGIETSIQIKNFRKEITIIAQTANAFTTDEVECYEAGCNGFLSKPIEKDNLLQYVSSFLDN